jgi:ketosteroid isomerase-like protein
MKKIILIAIAFSSVVLLHAQTKKETGVANAVEQLRKAMVDGDSVMLDKLVCSQLSYGHSGGHIDDKKEFMHKLTSGGSDFVIIELTEQTITVSKNVAVVRHILNAATNDGGKPGTVHLAVLLVWQKLHGDWKLLARQAVKMP